MNSADTADQMMKMTLEGIQVAAEVGLKAGGMAARSLAVTLYAILKDNKKVKGKTNLNNLLKSDKELKVFAIHHSDLKKFCEEAKHYGVLYSVLKTSVYKGYKRDKIEMRGDRAEMSDFPLYLNTVAGGLDRRDQTIGGFSFVVKIYAVPVVEIIG
jgi:hypothetical protein